jgi:hypothetical protein
MKKAVTDIGPGVISVELLKVCDFFYLFFNLLLFWLGSSLFMFPILNLGHTYCHSRICNLKLSP